MIVICTKCQAKFRVADEKIGPRGAKVRCSKCQTVFVVRREDAPDAAAPASSGLGLELEPPRAVPPPLPPPLPSAGAPGAFAAFPPPPVASPDPFAPGGERDPFAAPAPGDPFAPRDPFAPAAAPDPFAPPAAAADPFASPGAAADPFAPASAAADPFAAPAPIAADPGQLLAAAASAAPPPLPGAAPEPPAEASPGGLALEERTSSPPRPASSAPFDLDAGYDAFGAGEPQPFGAGALDLGGPAGAVPELATGGPAAEEPARAVAPATAGQRPFVPAEPRSAGREPEAPPAPDERIPDRPSRLRSVAVNAVALAALLVAAAAILAVWRTEGPIDAAALRPAAILAALRGTGADVPFAPRDVRSGLYERERAPPLLFVRGSVVSRAAAPVARVEVRVEVVRGGAVVASGRAIAGAVPTPEELWAARDGDALSAVAAAAARRAPAEVRPGDAIPFLVAIAGQPADLSGASLRVQAAPAGGAGP